MSDGPPGDDNTTSIVRENPWLGLASFEEQHSELFFGRSAEISEMERMVLRGPACLLFGRSGLGKTSLLCAGVFPRLRSKDCVPVYVRLNFAEDALPLAEQVKQELWKALEGLQIEARPPAPGETLWEYAHREDVDFWDSRVRLITPVLVFDQFEEIFTLGRRSPSAEAAVALLVEELQALINNAPPQSVRQRFEAKPELVSDYDFDKRTMKVLIGLREDFLAHFESARKQFHAAGVNRLRLEPLNGLQAMEAVLKPGEGIVDEPVAQRIVEFVAHDKKQASDAPLNPELLERWVVEPALLSVVCRELNERRRKARQPKITANLLTSEAKEEILLNFYEQAIGDMPEAVGAFVEDHLLTGAGYRDRASQDDALRAPGVTEASLDILVSRRLLRREETNGVVWLELSHDLLTGVVQQSRTRRQNLQAESARREAERRTVRYKLAVAVFAMIAIAALLFMWKFYEERAKAKELVKESSKEDLATAKQLFDEDQWGRGIAYLGHSLGLDPENSDAAIHFWSAVVYGRHGDGRLPLFWHDLRSASYGVFNPSGTCVLVATDNGSSVRDTVTGETLWSRPGVSAKVGAFSPDGKSLLTVNSSNGLVQIWNLTTNRIPKCTLQGVPETTLSAAFSADSSRIVVTGLDNGGRTAGVWDADGNNICILTNEGLVWIPNAAFSQDGKYVVTASGAGNDARVWDASSGAMLSWLAGAHEHTDWVMAAAFNPDGDMVVTSSNDKTARTWRWRSTNTLRVATNSMAVFPHNGSVVMASFNADGSRLVTASADGSARIWDPANGTRLADPLWHKSRVIAATFSSNAVGAIVVTRCADNTVHVWDARTGSPVGEPLQHGRNNSLYDAVFTGAGQTNLVTCGSQGFGLWNIDPLPPGRLLQHSNKVWSARFSPHGHELVTACNDGITRIWDATSTNEKPRLCLFTKDHEKEIRYAEFNSNGTWVVTAGPGEIARVWNAHTGSLLWTLTGHSKYLKVAKFNSAGTRVVTASIDGSARLFDLGQEPTAPVPLSSTLPALTHEKSVLWACFSPNDQFIITASLDRTARIWNATNGHLEATIIHHDWVLDAQFSQDSRSVATASYDRTVAFLDLTRDGDKEVWNPANCLSLSVPAKAVVVGFSPHGEFLAAGTEDGTVAVWAISELQRGTVPNPKTIHLGDKVNWLEFKDLGSKGLFLATASSHQTACLWRVLSGGQLESYCEPFPHQGDVLQVSYDPNGQYVATASDDKTAGIWMVPPRVAWDESMNSPTGEAAPHFSVGEALTDTIAGFRFDTNTGQIQPMRIEERLDLSKKLERYKFADDHWHNLFLWWEANSKACSTNARQPWPQEP